MNSNDNLSEQNAYLKELNALFIPLDGMENLDSMVKAIGDADIVLLGEASHGTSDFYQVRAELSKKLITSKGFNIIGVEGDWPSAYRLNRYVKGMEGSDSSAADALGDFTRWPTWMWANTDIRDFAEWLKEYNEMNQGAEVIVPRLDFMASICTRYGNRWRQSSLIWRRPSLPTWNRPAGHMLVLIHIAGTIKIMALRQDCSRRAVRKKWLSY